MTDSMRGTHIHGSWAHCTALSGSSPKPALLKAEIAWKTPE